jgi:hypothetical protein
VVTATGDDLTNTDDEMKVAMRQIAGAFDQLEKSRLVRKLREARDRKRAEIGKCEGQARWRATRLVLVDATFGSAACCVNDTASDLVERVTVAATIR